jgi:hypothetical protein
MKAHRLPAAPLRTLSALRCTCTALPASCGTRQSAGNVDVHGLFLTGRHADQRAFDVGSIAPEPITVTPFSTPSAGRRSSPPATRFRASTQSPACAGASTALQAAALQAQVLDHRSMSASVDLGGVADDVQLGDVDVAEIRHDFERGDIASRLRRARRPGSAGCRPAQRIARARRCRSLRAAAVEDFGADLLPDSAARSPWSAPCRAEALDPRGRAISRRRPPTWVSRRSAGRLKVMRRSRLPRIRPRLAYLTPAPRGDRGDVEFVWPPPAARHGAQRNGVVSPIRRLAASCGERSGRQA